ncbi:invasion associated locus B family protein [Sulfitobacter sp. S190]|uniref:invasion associated locus B family protein n=1 Tax=Sulfitobacter sp. S190 TaxID=2867022 RepID=UPI0021A7DE32|nr:invasion associated locus B family protein [Sulfitobacter sp. S190]UWR23341.1 invasion associated locus B family protein [Sulfitobacter sp. S190]
MATVTALALLPSAVRAQEGLLAVENLGAWTFECFDAGDAGRQCQLHHRTSVPDAPNVVVMAAAFSDATGGTLQAEIVLPLGIDLPTPPQLRIDGAVVASLPVSRCIAEGCLVEGILPRELVDQLQAAGTAAITTSVSNNAQTLTIPFPTDGFSDAITRLQEETALRDAANSGAAAQD